MRFFGTNAGIAIVLLLAGCGSASSRPTAFAEKTHALHGQLLLSDNSDPFNHLPDQKCSGGDDANLSTYAAGARVTVKNGAGDLIAMGSLDEGTTTGKGGETCKEEFAIPNVPQAHSYRVQIADRYEVNYSQVEMEAGGWRVLMSIQLSS